MGDLRVVPLELREANAIIRAWHRHHAPVVGHRFSLGVVDGDGAIHGAVVVGRPVSQHSGPTREVVEVTRLVTDGTKNACSMLYAAAARAARIMGYLRIQTFILEAEPGTSLKAAGWEDEGPAGGNSWGYRPGRDAASLGRKQRWSLGLNAAPDAPVQLPEGLIDDGQRSLFACEPPHTGSGQLESPTA